MKKLLSLFSILLFSIAIAGCENNTPDCPTCPDLTCPDGYEKVMDPETGNYFCELEDKGPSCGDLKGDYCGQDGVVPEGYTSLGTTWDCDPCAKKDDDVPPPPPDDKQPGDYVDKGTVLTKINKVEVDSRSDIYLDIWESVRHPMNVYQYCSDYADELGFSASEFKSMADRGSAYLDGREGWKNRIKPILLKTNKRCADPAFPDPKWCDKTEVHKDTWNTFKDNVQFLNTQELWVASLAAQQSACRQVRAFDNVMGWCCRCKGRGASSECADWVPPIL
jgi:hypothetical protein